MDTPCVENSLKRCRDGQNDGENKDPATFSIIADGVFEKRRKEGKKKRKGVVERCLLLRHRHENELFIAMPDLMKTNAFMLGSGIP
jgi:hypothetical protein